MLYYNPKSFDEALKQIDSLKDKDVVILAGGTDVVPKLNARPERSGYFDKPLVALENKAVVSLNDSGMNYIKDKKSEIAVGAMTTMSQLLDSPIIDKVPVLKEALNVLAGLTIRNVATVGGNIMNASPAADSVPALIALDASVVLASIDSERTLKLSELFVAPGKTSCKGNEILKEVIIPVREGKCNFIKFGRRKAESLSIVNGAAYANMESGICKNVVIALGAVAPTPLRVEAAERIMEGNIVTEKLIAEAADVAADVVKPIDDKRSSGDYRKKLVKVLVKRALTKVCC
ncbi:MAG: xanthine dehydrogenase family protein subunit M [Clostridiales bacterium]|nr:xanthine dehydrogenase family protein subunit M [Clostridiales bacterium]